MSLESLVHWKITRCSKSFKFNIVCWEDTQPHTAKGMKFMENNMNVRAIFHTGVWQIRWVWQSSTTSAHLSFCQSEKAEKGTHGAFSIFLYHNDQTIIPPSNRQTREEGGAISTNSDRTQRRQIWLKPNVATELIKVLKHFTHTVRAVETKTPQIWIPWLLHNTSDCEIPLNVCTSLHVDTIYIKFVHLDVDCDTNRMQNKRKRPCRRRVILRGGLKKVM